MGFDKQADTLIAHYEEQGKAQADAYKQQVLGEVAQAKQDLMAIQERCQGQLAEAESQLSSLREEISQAQQTYADISGKITAARGVVDQLKSEQASLGLDIEAMKEAGARELAAMEAQYTTRCEELEGAAADKLKQVQEAMSKFETVTAGVKTQEEVLQAKTTELVGIEERRLDAEIEFANLLTNIETAQADVVALSEKGVAVREELALTEKLLKEKQVQIQELDAQMLSLNQEIEQIAKEKAANTAMSKSLADRENEVRVQEKALAARRVELAKKEQDIKAAQAAIADL